MINVYDFITDSNLFKTFKVNDLMFVEYRCLIDEMKVEYWTHQNYFMYVLGGNKKWESGNKEYLLSDGDAVFIRKGSYVAHRYHDDDFCALLIFVPDEFIRSVLTKSAITIPAPLLPVSAIDPIISLDVDETLSAYFNSVFSYFPKSVSPPPELLTIKFEELILTVLTSGNNPELSSLFRWTAETSRVSIPDIMEANFMRNMSLEEYARLCARSLSAFKTDFYQIYKTSPGKWLINKRLEYARFLVETTDKSIQDVVFESGFKNVSHFIRLFKENYGQSPMKHRVA